MRVNRFVKDFLGTIEAKFADDSSIMPMSAWISGNTSLRKKPFSFEGYEFHDFRRAGGPYGKDTLFLPKSK